MEFYLKLFSITWSGMGLGGGHSQWHSGLTPGCSMLTDDPRPYKNHMGYSGSNLSLPTCKAASYLLYSLAPSTYVTVLREPYGVQGIEPGLTMYGKHPVYPLLYPWPQPITVFEPLFLVATFLPLV